MLARKPWMIGLLAVAAAGCGVESASSPANAPAQQTTQPSDVPASMPATVSATPRAAPNPDLVIVQVNNATVSLLLPEGSKPDPTTPAPDATIFVREGFYNSMCCKILVAAQGVEPKYPEAQLLDTIEVSGRTWKLYNAGPSDGSDVHAITQLLDGTWIGLLAQQFSPDVNVNVESVLRELVNSVTVKE